MPAGLSRVLIVGSGFSGMSAAIQLRKAGLAVDLVEIDPNWRPEGAGITISGATMRALETIGVYEEFVARGNVADGLELFAPHGHKVGMIPSPKMAGSAVLGDGGILRPELGRILAERTRASGVEVRVGVTYAEIEDSGDEVKVAFTDGTEHSYDLVVGAEGVGSKLREKLFPEADPPHYIGQVVWRAVLPRPAEMARPRMWVGGPVKVGVNPVSASHMYMFLTEGRPEKSHVPPGERAALMDALLRPFPDPVLQSLIPHLHDEAAAIDYRPLVNLLVPAPWNRGRIVLIGDAVPATTPHLASGAGIGIESAIVLAEELEQATTLQDALDRFHARRWDRCRMVVQNSERLGRIEAERGDMAEHGRIMRESLMALAAPI